MTNIKYRYNEEKNEKLKKERNIDFDVLMTKGEEITRIKNTSSLHQNQMKLIILYNNYCYSVPYVVEGDGTLFLKTAYKDRFLNKLYNK